MDSNLSVQNKNFSGDGKEFKKVPRAVGKAESDLHWRFIGVWQILWRSITESSNSTPHRSETNGIAERAVRRVKEGTSAVMLLPSAKCPRPPGRKFLLEHWLNIIRFQHEINQDFINLAGSFTRNLSWVCIDRGWNLERTYSYCGSRRIGKVGRVRNLSSKNQRERSIDITQGRRIHISSSRWYSQIVRKRLRIPKTHSEAGIKRKEWRSQWRTSRRTGRVWTDRTNRWRWSPCRLLVDPRWLHLSPSQFVPKEETCSIPLNYIDVTRSTFTDLDVMQEKRIDDYWNVDSNRSLSDSRKGLTKFTLLKEKPPRGYMWSWRDWQKFKRPRDQIR